MVTTRIQWHELPGDARDLVEVHTGPVNEAETMSGGFNSEIATVVRTEAGAFFVKGLRSDHPRVWTQETEATINRYVRGIAPELLWHAQSDGWNILGFECVDGRHADYSPDSADLPKIVETLIRLQGAECPDLPLKRAEQRLQGYVDDPATAELFAGDFLLHTDYNRRNVLVGDRAYLVDWAWATRGAGWIDPAYWLVWLMAEGGHTVSQAEAWAAQIPSWQDAPDAAVHAFAGANSRLWADIARDNQDSWTTRMASAALEWNRYRTD